MKRVVAVLACVFCSMGIGGCVAWVNPLPLDTNLTPEFVEEAKDKVGRVDEGPNNVTINFLPVWQFWDGKFVKTTDGFYATQKTELLPLKLHEMDKTAEYNNDGRLLSNTASDNAIWGVLFDTVRAREYYPNQSLLRNRWNTSVLLGIRVHGIETHAEEGKLETEFQTISLFGGLFSSDTIQTADYKEETIELIYGIFGSRKIGGQVKTLKILFVPIPM